MDYRVIKEFPDPGLADKWNVFLKHADYATHYVTPNFFVDPFVRGGERFAILAIDGNKIAAVVTGVKSEKQITSGLAVRPQTAFLKAAADGAEKALICGLEDLAGETGELVNFYAWEPVADAAEFGYESEQSKGADRVVMLDLSKGGEALFADFSDRRRRAIRKVIKDGMLEVKHLETEAELAELYEIHKSWNARKGFQPDSFQDYRLAWQQVNYRRVFIAIHEGKIVAGTSFRFCKGGVVEGAASTSLPEFQKLLPNELIMWRAIEWACAEGFSGLSMGASHPFLLKFGGELVGSYRFRHDRTLFKSYQKREKIERFAIKTYLALPDGMRKSIKSAASRIKW